MYFYSGNEGEIESNENSDIEKDYKIIDMSDLGSDKSPDQPGAGQTDAPTPESEIEPDEPLEGATPSSISSDAKTSSVASKFVTPSSSALTKHEKRNKYSPLCVL